MTTLATVPEREQVDGWRRFAPGSAERTALLALGDHLGIELRPMLIELGPGKVLEVEGADAERTLLLQVNVNQGAFSSAQRNKALADLFKLRWLATTRFPQARIGLLLNQNTAETFKPHSWTFQATQELGIVLYVFTADGRITELA